MITIFANNKEVGVLKTKIYDINWNDNRLTLESNNKLILHIDKCSLADLNKGYIEVYSLLTPRTTWRTEDENWKTIKIDFDVDNISVKLL